MKAYKVFAALLLMPVLSLIFVERANAQKGIGEGNPAGANFRIRTELTLLRVSATDLEGRTVTDLAPGDIQVFEDGIEQEVQFFTPDSAPLTHGLLLDSSGSMGRGMKMPLAQAAAYHFVETSSPDDRIFLVDFDSHASLTLDLTSNLNLVARALEKTQADGRTALFDAVYLGLSRLKDVQTENRKVLLLISDGADTSSRHSFRDVLELARESDVQIYAVGIVGEDMTYSAVDTIESLAEETGGKSYFPQNPQRMVQICLEIARELRQQYLLGYRSSNPNQDGSWRKIKLKVRQRDGEPKVIARTRKGYYARNEKAAGGTAEP